MRRSEDKAGMPAGGGRASRGADAGVAGGDASSVGRTARRSWRVVPDSQSGYAYTEVTGERASSAGVLLFSTVVFAVVFVVALGAVYLVAGGIGLVGIAVAVVAAALMTCSVHIAQEWERVVVLRFGKFNRVSGPGLFWTFPVIEQNTMRVDTRVRVTTFGAEETLTSDLVPLDVNAVLFWHVWDAKSACLEVGDFTRAVELAAQTALRDAIGRGGAAEVAIRRQQLDRELKHMLEEKVAPWGVTVLSVEIRDILMPCDLQDVMSLEAQAEQRKKARIILMEAEQDICEMVGEMGAAYAENDVALRLRAMHLLYESIRETGGTVVVPSSFSEGFGDILGEAGKAPFVR
ncbi:MULTISPECIES: slipin family protein [unclassified Adlercreutzia]|uniref:slipin family protein n=1 Tax=unclassified Adlercreutzia TaxID=2636013 RepID=UPI001F154D2A|nr:MULTISPECIES: slipin family protein [unclassified Adlercreutzia]